jgi:hypothetical protein
VRDSLAMLVQNNVISKERVSLKDEETGQYICIGQDIQINAFGIEHSDSAVEI